MTKQLFSDIIVRVVESVKSRSHYAPVAQLDRVTGYEPVGRGFESLPAHQLKPNDDSHLSVLMDFLIFFGVWLSLVEYLTGGQGAAGSSPVTPTIPSVLTEPERVVRHSVFLLCF